MPIAAYACDRSGTIIHFNEAAHKLWGRRPARGENGEKFRGSCRGFLPDGTKLPLAECIMAETVRSGKVARNVEIVIERPDGTRVTAMANTSPVWDADGVLVGAINCLVDISEHRRIERAAREHGQFVDDVLNSMTANVAVLDRDGVIVTVNDSWKEFGVSNGAAKHHNGFVGRSYLEVCKKCIADTADSYAREAYAGISAVLRGERITFTLECPCDSPNGPRWFSMRATRLNGSQGGAVVKHDDVTERKQLENATRRVAQGVATQGGAAFFHSLLEEVGRAAGTQFAFIGESLPKRMDRMRISYIWSPSGAEMNSEYYILGTPAEEILGRQLCCYPDRVRDYFPSDAVLREKGIVAYVGIPLFDSQDRPLGVIALMSRNPLPNPDLASALLRIIAPRVAGEIERERAANELNHLTSRLLRLQDEERRSLGRELHDSTAQELAALEINLAAVSRDSTRLSRASREALKTAAVLAGNCAREIRTLAFLLRPPLLDEEGLAAALRVHVRGFTDRSGIKCRLTLPAAPCRLESEVELALFRIAQEALANVHRHSASKSVSVKLTLKRDRLLLEIADRGHGMPVEALEAFRANNGLTGIGLMGMSGRMRQLGGQFKIQSTRRGTRVQATVPRGNPLQ